MNLHKKPLHSVLAIGLELTAITSAFGQRLVTVYADEAAYASEQAITYEAVCPSGKYRLTFTVVVNKDVAFCHAAFRNSSG